MSLEESKAVIRRMYEALNKHDLALLDEFFAPDCVNHTRQLRGLEQVKQYINTIFKGSSDLQVTIEDIIAEGDRVWVRLTNAGTHTGELHGLAPAGEKVTTSSVEIFRIVDGKIMEGWTILDLDSHLSFFKKLGVIEPTEKGKIFFSQRIS